MYNSECALYIYTFFMRNSDEIALYVLTIMYQLSQ